MITNDTLVLNLPFLRIFKISLNLKFLWLFIFLIILSLLIVCIFQLNAYTKEFYLIQNYEKKLNQLTQENKNLEINFSQANSLKHLGSYLENQVFEKAERIEYIRVLEGTVLAK
jgi:energy-coupling factor transporter transmembrane protein EcfT